MSPSGVFWSSTKIRPSKCVWRTVFERKLPIADVALTGRLKLIPFLNARAAIAFHRRAFLTLAGVNAEYAVPVELIGDYASTGVGVYPAPEIASRMSSMVD